MFLKSLTIRGFKSFADSTVLRFEPGLTVIVGPNGSGKSNVVDAIAWVLGEQGARALRGGRMEDVIFAGTPARPALGRAEVTLTIDNTAGLLPIAYSEVAITRLLYRSGESEYSINRTPCRLLDIAELLSDTGVGRELHTILSQGHLDDVLHGRPEDRRAAIEEAAGVDKHRRRKEKALRKLGGMEQNLLRLGDLVGELRRQLKPLQQQAETAERAAAVAAELRELRLVQRVRELATARSLAEELEALAADEERQRIALEQAAERARAAEASARAALAATAPRAAEASETAHGLVAVRERLRGTAALASERARHLAEPPAEGERSGRRPEDLLAEADEVAAQLAGINTAILAGEKEASAAEALRIEARERLAAFDASTSAAEQSRAAALAHRLELGSQAAAARQRIESAVSDRRRLEEEAEQLDRRAEEAARLLAGLQAEREALEAREAALAEWVAEIEIARDHAGAESARLSAEERRLEAAGAAAAARREALENAARAAGGDVLAALNGDVVPLAISLSVAPGYEVALAAALGSDADALVLASAAAAERALERLAGTAAGRARLLHPPATSGAQPVPGGAALLEHVTAEGPAGLVIAGLLADVLVAEDLAAGRTLLEAHPRCRVVTASGELLALGRVEGGAAPAASLLVARRAADEAAAEQLEATALLEQLGPATQAAEAAFERLEDELYRATHALNEADARIGQVAGRIEATVADLDEVQRRRAIGAERLRQLEAQVERDQACVQAAEAGLETAARGGNAERPDPPTREPLVAALEGAAQRAADARVATSTLVERRRLLAARESDLRAQAEAERAADERRRIRAAARAEGAARARRAADLAATVLGRLEVTLALATRERDSLAAEAAAARATLERCEAERVVTEAALDGHRGVERGSSAARVEARVRADDAARRLTEEFGLEPDEALAEHAIDERALAALPESDPRRLPDVELRRAAAVLERRLALLGRVNPLALEEFKALEERYAFLAGQLQDLKESKRDLRRIVAAVDTRVREVFSSAFEDVAEQFTRTFALLFPGGEGRLVLTDPDDLLATGIEIDVRLPGKRVRRLSLLSGGERSLVALAFCFAIFRARPSPFYVLDEVEAALDDVNLRRFIDLLADMRREAQLLVVSHQRRTMEAADVLYGVSMPPGGVTTIVSQRLRDDPAPIRRSGRSRVAEIDVSADTRESDLGKMVAAERA